MKQLSSHQFSDVYKSLGIDVRELGCVMLDVKPFPIKKFVEDAQSDLYYSEDEKKYWIKGCVGEDTAHVTLLYGLMKPATEYKKEVDAVLKDWSLDRVEIDTIDYFESRYDDEAYYCVIAKIKVTPELEEGNARLRFLPHIDTFPTYTPHVTLAYIKKDQAVLDKWLSALKDEFIGELLAIDKINLGGSHD